MPENDPDEIRDVIKTRGYYHTVIRPFPVEPDRYERPANLKDVLVRNEVRIQGWSYPPVIRDELIPAGDYLHSGVSFEGFKEYYRLYFSGQFAHLRGFWEDWPEDMRQRRSGDFPSEKFISIEKMLGSFVGLHRFARNLAEEMDIEEMEVQIGMHDIDDRHLLHSRGLSRWVRGDPTTTEEEWTNTWSYTAEELMADADELGWNVFTYACEMMNYELPSRYPNEWNDVRDSL